jgi:hypothetical protein
VPRISSVALTSADEQSAPQCQNRADAASEHVQLVEPTARTSRACLLRRSRTLQVKGLEDIFGTHRCRRAARNARSAGENRGRVVPSCRSSTVIW